MAGIFKLDELPTTASKLPTKTPKTIKATKIVSKIEEEIIKEESTEKRIELVRKILKEKAPSKLPDPEVRCLARVFTTKPKGCAGQCRKKRIEKSDFCGFHNEQNIMCSKPCSFTKDGKRIGLFFGRVDKEIPYLSEDGFIAIDWKDDNKDLIARAKTEGKNYRPDSDIPGHATKKTREPPTGPYHYAFEYYFEENEKKFIDSNPGVKKAGLLKIAKTIYAHLDDKSKYEKMLEDKKPRKEKTTEKGGRKKPDPKRAKTSYQLFSEKIAPIIRAEKPEMKFAEVNSEVAKRWKALPETSEDGLNCVEYYKKLAEEGKKAFLEEHPDKAPKPKEKTPKKKAPTSAAEAALSAEPAVNESVIMEPAKTSTMEKPKLSPKTLKKERKIIDTEDYGKTFWKDLKDGIESISYEERSYIEINGKKYDIDGGYNLYKEDSPKAFGKLEYNETLQRLEIISI